MKKLAAAVIVTAILSVGAAAQTPAPAAPPPAPVKVGLLAYMERMIANAERDLLEAAELMPEEHYSFKATTETKPFGQVVAHIGLSRVAMCAARSGKENPHRGEKEEAPRTKAQLVALLKEGTAMCASAREGLTDAALVEMVKVGTSQNETSRGSLLVGDIAHGWEMYGTMAVYLRLKGLVPPSTARQNKARGSQ